MTTNKTAATLAPLPSLPKRSKTVTPRQCACGCDRLTKGGRFVPGHDSRRLGWAIRLWAGHSVEGITPGERKAAEAFIASGEAAKLHPASFPARPATEQTNVA